MLQNIYLTRRDKNGFALVTVMVAMLVMVFLGVAAMIISSAEIEVAGIDKIYKDTFYQADGGTNLAAEMLEQNANCSTGFAGNANANVDTLVEGTVYVFGGTESSGNSPDGFGSRNFAYNINLQGPSNTNRDFVFPVRVDGKGYHPTTNPNAPHTNITIGGQTVLAAGSSIIMAAGYEGKGKGAGAGGAHVDYGIMAERLGLVNSTSVVWMGWRHVVGTEGPCTYK